MNEDIFYVALIRQKKLFSMWHHHSISASLRGQYPLLTKKTISMSRPLPPLT